MLGGSAQHKRFGQKSVDKEVPNSIQEQGKELIGGKRFTGGLMEPTIGLEPMTC
jgi:hypothetical protein